MIPRTLVPVDIRKFDASEPKPAPRRLSSTLDERTIVPRDLPITLIDDATSAIPSHVPRDVIVARSLIDRSWHVERSENRTGHRVETYLDERSVVPSVVSPQSDEGRQKLEVLPQLTAGLLDVIDPDVMTTGDVNLLATPHEDRDARWNNISRMFSLAFHVGIILLALSSPEFFKHIPTDDEVALAQKQLGSFLYIPSDAIPRNPGPRGPVVRINPKALKNKIAPPEIPAPPSAPPVAKPTPSVNDLPAAPVPHPNPTATQPSPNTSSALAPIPMKPAEPTPGKLNLSIPNMSPGRAIQNSVQDAANQSSAGGLRPAPSYPGEGGGGGGGGGGGHGPGMGQGYQIMTPTDGVDFSAYIQRLLASLQRNWWAIIPESARLGDKGAVVTQFKILPSGQVPEPDPTLIRTSGKEPLDRAAMSAIHASNPFEPLPSAYHRPYFEIRIIFLYNLPLDYYQ
ncbi:MAG: TonB C-terminal domain-containing protein [Candidatus Acidiferrales bacterium]